MAKTFAKITELRVLILVLLELSLWAKEDYDDNERMIRVLILVLLELSLWALSGTSEGITSGVLILVLLELSLWGL